ncbi:hypothetical protein [Stenotrophomonas sp. MMGLT7]|uniref:hypothetical protein n=1 Tax=Stenotrophomonas sp. MMGLT7 TaxID=2901227 RepID=UPI001E599D44|nr:hypothetical protein [Stenotrophomonas sp. MMGLT7]MCD7098153.1 hypothetical protein [Stenotrophomonas sp. MMGLT7]
MSASPASARSHHWLWPLLLLLGAVTITVAWIMLALASGRQSGWMALVAALESAWMLRLGGLRRRGARIAVAMAATAAVVVAANWGIASAYIGGAMGLDLWSSLLKMGPYYAWTLSALANTPLDLLWVPVALVVAAFAAR